MTKIFTGKDGNMHMRRVQHTDHRMPFENMKAKEPKCWVCGSLPHRVEKPKCNRCGLVFEEEVIEMEIPGLKSSQGTFEDKF